MSLRPAARGHLESGYVAGPTRGSVLAGGCRHVASGQWEPSAFNVGGRARCVAILKAGRDRLAARACSPSRDPNFAGKPGFSAAGERGRWRPRASPTRPRPDSASCFSSFCPPRSHRAGRSVAGSADSRGSRGRGVQLGPGPTRKADTPGVRVPAPGGSGHGFPGAQRGVQRSGNALMWPPKTQTPRIPAGLVVS